MLRGEVWRISQLLEFDASEPIQLELPFPLIQCSRMRKQLEAEVLNISGSSRIFVITIILPVFLALQDKSLPQALYLICIDVVIVAH